MCIKEVNERVPDPCMVMISKCSMRDARNTYSPSIRYCLLLSVFFIENKKKMNKNFGKKKEHPYKTQFKQ